MGEACLRRVIHIIINLSTSMDIDFFNTRAKRWSATRRMNLEKLQYLLRRLDIQPGMRVLDAGCGDGVLTRLLSEAVEPDGFVVGVDAASGMIAEAKALHPGLRNVHYQVADLETMPFCERYDRIIMLDVLPHLKHPMKSVVRMVREAMEPEGQMLIAHDAGRATVNHLHQSLALSEASELPPVDLLSDAFEAEGLRVLHRAESEEYYYLLLSL
jgi:2-polyprenyl-3-methyl-5-hydroxy-6-metoxy-1,4-benzoquinol methylase